LIVAYSAWAEMTCFLSLGWPFPRHVFCSHTAYLAASNVLAPWDSDEQQKHKKPRKRLPDACRAYGIRGWETIDKDVIAKDIAGGNWRKWGQETVIAYCEEDVAMTVSRRSFGKRGSLHRSASHRDMDPVAPSRPAAR
jgi:hypothetical protein